MGHKGNSLKILLVSGIFPPDVGGPAIHVSKIAAHFVAIGWQPTVIAFGEQAGDLDPCRVIRVSRRFSKLLSWGIYALYVFRESFSHDVLYAFDLTTAGLPSALSALLLRKPLLLRIGGDPIWEREVEKGRRFVAMRAYYEQGLFKLDKPVLYKLIRFVVRRARAIALYNDYFKNIYTGYYGAPLSAISVILNPIPPKQISKKEEGKFTFIFAGRFVSYKNLDRVIRVFNTIHVQKPQARLLLIGNGPEKEHLVQAAKESGDADAIQILPAVNQKTLFTYAGNASVALAPAITEFNPNFILEMLALGKPVLISKESDLTVRLPAELQFNPMDDKSLKNAMLRIMDPDTYTKTCHWVENLSQVQTWEDVVLEHERLVRGVVKFRT